MESSINRLSDYFFDFSCFTCQGNGRNTEAEVYCEVCSTCFCGKCVKRHNYLYNKHTPLDKKNVSKWPEANVGELEQCKEHKKEKLSNFCEDHNQLICKVCHGKNHETCRNVIHIAAKWKDLSQNGDFKKLSEKIDTQLQRLIAKREDFEKNLKSLDKSYTKNLKKINALWKKINSSLDKLEKKTKCDLDKLQSTMRTSIKTDIENCTESIENITRLKDQLFRQKDKTEAVSFIKYIECRDQSLKIKAFLKDIKTKNETILTYKRKAAIQQTLSILSSLGKVKQSPTAESTTLAARNTVLSLQQQPSDLNQAIRVKSIKTSQTAESTTQKAGTSQEKPTACNTVFSLQQHRSDPNQAIRVNSSKTSQTAKSTTQKTVTSRENPTACNTVFSLEHQQSDPNQAIKVKSSKRYRVNDNVNDCKKCTISGICETACGQLLITDWKNNNVMLLDKTYAVVSTFDLPDGPRSVCSIDSSLVAVTMFNTEVHFIKVTNGRLTKDETLVLKHACVCIAHRRGNLYITDSTALHRFTLEKKLSKKLYTHKPGSVTTCAVSPDEDRIYMASNNPTELVTLRSDGKVTCFTCPRMEWEDDPLYFPGLHVTDSGHVLVCGMKSNIILKLDKNGSEILAEVVKVSDNVNYPMSVYYSELTGSLIVGMKDNNYIKVFDLQPLSEKDNVVSGHVL
ncbi:hypothetical protein DPMN_092260 [Dreissena polymorpha]|uniref:B box-type domain-containing protein n=1 Tax=Dreissena polymorpha TaxID=45954 RepID=A0A9D4QZV2_DREPO|nr:hypothetical protein DPMN_092260 [Dreissena polymorpha]